MTLTPLAQMKQDLIASIENERRSFNMENFASADCKSTDLPKCGTALCMAGHVLAIRQKTAKRLAGDHAYTSMFTDKTVGYNYDDLAKAVWKEETGQECRLDFFAEHYDYDYDELPEGQPRGGMSRIPREDAVAHIKGRSRKWPLVPREG